MTHSLTHSHWVLRLAIDIDSHCTGFLGKFYRASAERRQVISAYLASRPPAGHGMSEAGEFLLRVDHCSILAAAHGEVAQGMRGALRRAGETVHERQFYSILHKLLSKPPHENVQRCIARTESLDLTKLRIINLLPPTICYANVLESIDGIQHAKDVVIGFRLLLNSGIDEADLAKSFRQVVPGDGAISKLFRRWVLECRAPNHPVAASATYRPITSASELDRIAHRYRNCARTYITNLLDGQAGHAFAEMRHGREGVVVHLTRHESRWWLEGLFGRGNAGPSPSMRTVAEDYLAGNGIEVGSRRRPSNSDWDSVRRLMARPGMDFLLDLA